MCSAWVQFAQDPSAAGHQGCPTSTKHVPSPSPPLPSLRSLRQLRREVADRLASKQAAAPAGLDSEEEGEEHEYIGTAAVRAT